MGSITIAESVVQLAVAYGIPAGDALVSLKHRCQPFPPFHRANSEQRTKSRCFCWSERMRTRSEEVVFLLERNDTLCTEVVVSSCVPTPGQGRSLSLSLIAGVGSTDPRPPARSVRKIRRPVYRLPVSWGGFPMKIHTQVSLPAPPSGRFLRLHLSLVFL